MKKNNKGFTLAELLIVVAIIAVLTAVAIPIFTTQLEKSREETDIANMRAAKAAAVAYFLDNVEETAVYFDADQGIVVKDKTSIAHAYGKGTTTNGKSEAYEGYSNTTAYKGMIVKVTRTVTATDGNVESLTATWETK